MQFSTFAALTSYEDAVEEEARLTDVFAEITEDRQEEHKRLISRHVALSGTIWDK